MGKGLKEMFHQKIRQTVNIFRKRHSVPLVIGGIQVKLTTINNIYPSDVHTQKMKMTTSS